MKHQRAGPVRRVSTTFALALFLCGCGGEPVTLLTGGGGGCLPGPPTGFTAMRQVAQGLLVADPRSGTAIKSAAGGIELVMWPSGYTGRRLFGGEVEVLDPSGQVVVTTGRKVVLGRQALNETAEAVSGAFPACGASDVP